MLFIENQSETKINEVTIYNIMGQKEYHRKGIINNIDISGLKAGYYNVILNSDKLIFRQKIIKQ